MFLKTFCKLKMRSVSGITRGRGMFVINDQYRTILPNESLPPAEEKF
jgi:hypothetical protein